MNPLYYPGRLVGRNGIEKSGGVMKMRMIGKGMRMKTMFVWKDWRYSLLRMGKI